MCSTPSSAITPAHYRACIATHTPPHFVQRVTRIEQCQDAPTPIFEQIGTPLQSGHRCSRLNPYDRVSYAEINSSASDAFTSVGQYCDGTLAKCPVTATGTTALPYGALASVNAGCLNTGGTASQCSVTPISSAHWIINDITAAQILGSPFPGVAGNTERGQPISTASRRARSSKLDHGGFDCGNNFAGSVRDY